MKEQQVNNTVKRLIERIFFPKAYRRRKAIMRLRRMSPLFRKWTKMQARIICEWVPKIYDTPRNIMLEDIINE